MPTDGADVQLVDAAGALCLAEGWVSVDAPSLTVFVATAGSWGAWRLSFGAPDEPVVQRPDAAGAALEKIDLDTLLSIRVVSPKGEVRWLRRDLHRGRAAVVEVPTDRDILHRTYRCWEATTPLKLEGAPDGWFGRIDSAQVGEHWVWVPNAGQLKTFRLHAVEVVDYTDDNATVIDEICTGFSTIPRPPDFDPLETRPHDEEDA